jgi:protein TonB
MRFYPQAAQKRGMEGSATLECVVTAKGLLDSCRVLAETPKGVGFGEAAIRMAILFRMKPETRSGNSVEGGVVKLPINFRLPR